MTKAKATATAIFTLFIFGRRCCWLPACDCALPHPDFQDHHDNQQVLSLFLMGLNLRGMSLDNALRKMVLTFRMPGEAQQIDR